MTREEAKKEIEKVFEPAFANYIITALTEGATVLDKALEQEPILDKIRVEIEKIPTAQPTAPFTTAYATKREVLRIIDKYKAESEEEE